MKLTVRVKPNARKNEVVQREDGTYLLSVNVPPTEGKANEKIIELLSEYLKKPKSSLSILRGIKSKNKIIEVL